MKKLVATAVVAVSFLLMPMRAWGASLIPGGQVIGLQVSDDRVCVAEFDGKIGQRAMDAGLQVGDEILQIDGVQINGADDVRKVLKSSNGRVELKILRKNKTHSLSVEPMITVDGPRLGVLLRQGVTGIGTVTYYDPLSGKFGSLGHGVSDAAGELVQMTDGQAYRASVISVVKGKAGQPGQLRGGVGAGEHIGKLEKNTNRGLFGTMERPWTGQVMETAKNSEIRTGAATILSTVAGSDTQEYSVEVLKLYPNNRTQGRNMLIRVTDQRLLQTTGGIVQGMSGSPIIQNGKIIGAVTHVLVNDPTMGYGIFIDNMLDAAA